MNIKSTNSEALKFIVGGIIIGATALSNSLIPWQVKAAAAALLFSYGVFLLFKGGENADGTATMSRKTARWVVVGTIALLFVGGVLYYVLPNKSGKAFDGIEGKFEISMPDQKYPGTARMDSSSLVLQFAVSPGLQIKSISLSNTPELEKAGLMSICALNKNYQVMECSTSLASSKGFSEQFFDDGVFTIMFQFKEDLKLDDLGTVSFAVLTNRGADSVVIHPVED